MGKPELPINDEKNLRPEEMVEEKPNSAPVETEEKVTPTPPLLSKEKHEELLETLKEKVMSELFSWRLMGRLKKYNNIMEALTDEQKNQIVKNIDEKITDYKEELSGFIDESGEKCEMSKTDLFNLMQVVAAYKFPELILWGYDAGKISSLKIFAQEKIKESIEQAKKQEEEAERKAEELKRLNRESDAALKKLAKLISKAYQNNDSEKDIGETVTKHTNNNSTYYHLPRFTNYHLPSVLNYEYYNPNYGDINNYWVSSQNLWPSNQNNTTGDTSPETSAFSYPYNSQALPSRNISTEEFIARPGNIR